MMASLSSVWSLLKVCIPVFSTGKSNLFQVLSYAGRVEKNSSIEKFIAVFLWYVAFYCVLFTMFWLWRWLFRLITEGYNFSIQLFQSIVAIASLRENCLNILVCVYDCVSGLLGSFAVRKKPHKNITGLPTEHCISLLEDHVKRLF